MKHTDSPLYGPDLAPVSPENRTWNKWNLAALWVGMAVCIPTYILASYMIRSGLSWQAALIIIGLANLVITLPMVLNGHAGVKYGIPFPVIGRSAFGTRGIHVVSIVRAIVACGWFGVQTWVGGLAIYSIWNAAVGYSDPPGLNTGEFVCFGIFWFINMYFIWKGTESIKWLEDLSAPILILVGLALIYWGYQKAGGFSAVLDNGAQLGKTTAVMKYNSSSDEITVHIYPILDAHGNPKGDSIQAVLPKDGTVISLNWEKLKADHVFRFEKASSLMDKAVLEGTEPIHLRFIKGLNNPSELDVSITKEKTAGSKLWEYLLWFTAMVGFWATMSISISDITRYAKSQKDQLAGQFLGLPGTMIFYSFVGIFVTSASLLAFDDVIIVEDAPWDPVSLVAKFKNPVVVILAQIAMIIATLSTNIAANVIAPANAFSNLSPKKINFRQGGYIAGIIGIVICPWWLMNEISGILIFISGLLGPVLGILLCDYFMVRKTNVDVDELFNPSGIYAFGGSGFHGKAMIALAAGVLAALIGYWVPVLEFLYSLSWFTGFGVSFLLYWILVPTPEKQS
ncbi:MAG TPA: NCS1 family nucleobase:cation symporter-1 [Catalimonadaceae bacterium]|nr:NCS1 family nucleobase:cation symporter-1 [Catalimonadaceae bacterium]